MDSGQQDRRTILYLVDTVSSEINVERIIQLRVKAMVRSFWMVCRYRSLVDEFHIEKMAINMYGHHKLS